MNKRVIKALVADDREYISRVIEIVLRELSGDVCEMEVARAGSVGEAMKKIEDNIFNVIVTDFDFNEQLTGINIIGRALKVFGDEILIIPMSADKKNFFRALDKSCFSNEIVQEMKDNFIEKPFHLEEFSSRINAWLGKKDA